MPKTAWRITIGVMAQLPTRPVFSEEKRPILGEFYDTFSRQPWFCRTEYVEAQPKDTIQVYATQSAFDVKDVLAFMGKYRLDCEIINTGTPETDYRIS